MHACPEARQTGDKINIRATALSLFGDPHVQLRTAPTLVSVGLETPAAPSLSLCFVLRRSGVDNGQVTSTCGGEWSRDPEDDGRRVMSLDTGAVEATGGVPCKEPTVALQRGGGWAECGSLPPSSRVPSR